MAITVKVDNQELKELKESLSNARISGAGVLSDSWIISEHLRDISSRCFKTETKEFNVGGILITLLGERVIIAGANLADNSCLKKLSGKSFKIKVGEKVRGVSLGEVASEVQFIAKGKAPNIIPLSFLMNAVSFTFKDEAAVSHLPEFYAAISMNDALMKEIGFPVLKSGEMVLPCHLMDFECTPKITSTTDQLLRDYAGTIVG